MEYIKIVDSKNFNNMLVECFGNDYALGIHGINNDDCYILVNDSYQLNISAINSMKSDILQNGLDIQEGRHLLSTVMFDGFNSYVMGRGNYDAGGVIIGMPKVIKNTIGEEIFVGSPTEHSEYYLTKNRNYDFTSLSDIVLPDYNENGGKLNSMFILASYEKLENDKIKISFNPNHVFFQDGILPQLNFDMIKERIKEIYSYYDINLEDLNESFERCYTELSSKDNLMPIDKAILKTIEQYNKDYLFQDDKKHI